MLSLSMIVTVIALALAAIGFLLGLMRGVRRSLVRLGVVLLSAVLAFFLATSIAGTLLNTPIAELGMSMEDVGLEMNANDTLHDFMISALQADETVAQLTEAAPTLTNFITLLPQALISEVLFIVLFFVLKVLLWLPEKIIDWVFLRKKGSRLLGAVVGAVQGVVCASVLLVPLFAVVPMMDSLVAATNDLSDEAKENMEIVASIQDLDESFCQQIKSDPVYRVLDAIGVRSIGENVFYSLSNVSTNEGKSVCVFGEIRDTLPVFVKIMPLTTLGTSGELSDNDIASIRAVLSSINDSALLSDTLTEVVTAFARCMKEGEPFLGTTLPADQDPAMQAFMNDLFGTLADSNKQTLMADLSDIVDLIALLSQNGVLTPSEEPLDMMTLLGDKEFTTELLQTMVGSHLLAPVSVSAVNNLGIATLAEALEIPVSERDELKISNIQIFSTMTDAEREQEASRLATILAGAVDLIKNIENGFDFQENLGDFGKIGVLLNAMSDSALLSNSAKGIMVHFLDMDTVKEVMTESSLALIRQRIDDGTIDYEATLGSIAAAYEMANALHVSDPELNDPEKLASAVENLFTSMDETTAEILKETISTEMLENMGIPEDTADVASTVLGTFFEEVAKVSGDESIDFEKEAAAVESVLTMITGTTTSDGAPSEAVTDAVIENILESKTITNTVINVSEQVDLSGYLSDTDRDTVADVLDNYSNDAVDQETLSNCLDALRGMLGIQ